jgi:histidine triad (HIT) family protein
MPGGAPECLFCRIARRQVPADIVGETDGWVAFQDINPQAPTHLLVVPSEHVATLADATAAHPERLGQAMQFISRLAQQYQLSAGYRVVVNCGAGAGQSVFHLHFHLLGGRPLRWPPG